MPSLATMRPPALCREVHPSAERTAVPSRVLSPLASADFSSSTMPGTSVAADLAKVAEEVEPQLVVVRKVLKHSAAIFGKKRALEVPASRLADADNSLPRGLQRLAGHRRSDRRYSCFAVVHDYDDKGEAGSLQEQFELRRHRQHQSDLAQP